MLLFGGAVFIMLAGTIRAVTILTVSISPLGILRSCFAETDSRVSVRSRRRCQRQLLGLP